MNYSPELKDALLRRMLPPNNESITKISREEGIAEQTLRNWRDKARTAQGMTREQLARIVDYDPRHLQAIENEGQKPSLELFIQLMTMFNISVDEYIFPNKEVNKSSARRRLDAQLDNLDDKELSIVEATANGLCKAKE